MRLKKVLGGVVAAALLAVGGLATSATPAQARELTPIGSVLCSNTPKCGIEFLDRAPGEQFQEGRTLPIKVTGQVGRSVSLRMYVFRSVNGVSAIAPLQGTSSFTVTPRAVTGQKYGQVTLRVPIGTIPAGYNSGDLVVVQPSDYKIGHKWVARDTSVDDERTDTETIWSSRPADRQSFGTDFNAAKGTFTRHLERALPYDQFVVQLERWGSWVTISPAGMADAIGEVHLKAQVPASLPSGTYRTRVVNITRDDRDISRDLPQLRLSWALDPKHPNFNVYMTPGTWDYNGRKWRTSCEAYSSTQRCRTEIWATQIVYSGGTFKRSDGYVFNNLTYLPSARSLWASNPLGGNGRVGYNSTWSKDGRQWRTECDTAATGKGGCRSYIMASVAEQYVSGGRTQFRVVNKWVMNNIVLFT